MPSFAFIGYRSCYHYKQKIISRFCWGQTRNNFCHLGWQDLPLFPTLPWGPEHRSREYESLTVLALFTHFYVSMFYIDLELEFMFTEFIFQKTAGQKYLTAPRIIQTLLKLRTYWCQPTPSDIHLNSHIHIESAK